MSFRQRARCAAALAICAGALALPGSASAGVFGTKPLNISTNAAGTVGNGPSGHPAVSGDNRKVRYVAFDSDASNLVAGDDNAARDVFVWRRPSGRAGNKLNKRGIGKLELVSVSSGGARGNATSELPSLDGSMRSNPHCVAFQSRATNLAASDATPDSDVFLRDLTRNSTTVLSDSIQDDAVNASVNGKCTQVLFEAGGTIYLVSSKGGKPKSLGAGTNPRFSRDSLSMVWVKSGKVVFKHAGRNRTFGKGSNPLVSDQAGSGAGWAIAYQAGRNVKLALVRKNGNTSTKTLLRGSRLGGVSVYAAERGIIVYAKKNTLFYLNRNSGNSDDLAVGKTPISEIAISARTNIVAFAAPGGIDYIDAPGNTTKSVYIKYLPQ